MHNAQHTTETTIAELNALIETNLDSVELLEIALESLKTPNLRREADDMRVEHSNAAMRLQNRVRALGGTPATAPHATNALKASWQAMWKGGNDEQAMLAMRANERVAVDGFKMQLTKENIMQTMTEEGLMEHRAALEVELRHFQRLTDLLRNMGVAVDNDEVMGAVRNATEHIHAAINLSGAAMEAFFKWLAEPGSSQTKR